MDDDRHDHDRGLGFDVSTLLARRRALQLLAGAGLATLIGCGSDSNQAATTSTSTTSTTGSSTTGSSTTGSSTTEADSTCSVIPEETAGPYPGDGSNGPNVLADSGVVRQDIRSSFGSSTTVATGVPLTINLTIQDPGSDCAPLAGAAVYVWHCDRAGNYSLYSQAAASENYLRGVQAADDNGLVTFQSIFPACYSGRWPHIHFEVYPSLEMATDENNKIATSQVALPKETCDLVYATSGYEQSVGNLQQVSVERDMVFSDGVTQQLGTVTGTVDQGLAVALMVPVGA